VKEGDTLPVPPSAVPPSATPPSATPPPAGPQDEVKANQVGAVIYSKD